MLKTNKVLLIVVLMLYIFQLVIMATAIDIGVAAVDMDSTITAGYCRINKLNPANETGKITIVEIWAATELAGCQVGVFEEVSADTLTTRDFETVNNGNGAGVVLAGSKQTFAVDLTVTAGFFIGIYYSAGTIEADWGDSPGTNVWVAWVAGIKLSNESCDDSGSREGMALYGTGATAEVSETNIMFTFGDF